MTETKRTITPACPLHTPEWVARMDLELPGGYASVRSRRTGATTRMAIGLILKALQTPYEPLTIIDHHPTRAADKYLADKIRDMIARLELEQMYLARNHSGFTLTYGKRP